MITITKERLLTIKQWRETYGPGSSVVLPAEEAEELARIALASLEAEPVAWTDEEELRDVRKYGFGEIFQCPPDKYADPRRVISLYRELPAPVVPDDWQLVPKKITLEMECALSKADSYEIGWLWALAAAPKYEVQNAKRVQNALNACRAAMLQSGNFRENKNSSTNNFREIAETSTNYPAIPSEVLSAILKVARIRADFDDFDGDRRGIGDCLDEAEQELIVTINKYASQLAAEPIATNDVREQQTAVPPVPEIQDDVAQAIENLKQKLVECNRYNYCADAVKGVEDACHAAMLHSAEPASNHEELPLDYLQGQKDGLEWAAQLAEANHPQTGDWLYDDPLELAKAIRKGPDMPEFDGPTPGTPDGWISCSELMPDDGQHVIILCDGAFVLYAQYRDGEFFDIVRNGDEFFETQSRNVTHWMPLPEPPQEAK
ncbi:TPA: DUF551 domain-containing protein [Escherichia coli]|nr:DUF551 domain-containing protein [Escherichia coli]